MAKTPEGEVKEIVKKYLEGRGAYVFSPVVAAYGQRTVDILVCLQGLFIAIETKGVKTELTGHQAETLKRVTAAGGLALWGNDPDYIIRQIEKRIPS